MKIKKRLVPNRSLPFEIMSSIFCFAARSIFSPTALSLSLDEESDVSVMADVSFVVMVVPDLVDPAVVFSAELIHEFVRCFPAGEYLSAISAVFSS